ncbi:ATP-binding protein [Streptomyces microflavus]|uniref:ATP-binding protein n=1 Tax=Streptomyces microflavus TaxID=1919 RepID=UPI003830B10B
MTLDRRPEDDTGMYLRSTAGAFTAHLAAGEQALRRLRELTDQALQGRCTQDTTDSAKLVLSELVGNAVRAGGDQVPLIVEVQATETGAATVSVTDPIPDRLPRASPTEMADPEAESGRGLPLLHVLCEEIDIDISVVGKRIRCRLPA